MGDFLLSISSSLITFRNVFGYLLNYFILSFTSFSPSSFVDFVNGADTLFTPLLILLLGYRIALKFFRAN